MRRAMRMTVAGLALALLVGGAGAPAGAADPPPGRTTDDCFVDGVIPIFARRPATAAERADALARLAGGTPRARLVRDLGRSDLWVHAEVTALYRTVLDRDPEPAGLAYWSDRFRAGVPVSDLGASIWSSAEMRRRITGGDRGVVGSLFLRVIGRPATSSESNYWTEVTGRKGWAWVARQMYRTAEYRGRQVDRLYRTVLGRAPEASGRAYWSDRLLRVNEVELAIQLAASPELLARAVATCAPPGAISRLVAGGGGPAASQVSHDGTVVLFWSARAGLVPGDEPGTLDLFVLDRSDGSIVRVFARTTQDELGGDISADGSTVAFATATALVAGDDDGRSDVHVWDRATGTVRLVGGAPQGLFAGPAVSGDGSRVVWSEADGVVVWDEATDTTTDLRADDADVDVWGLPAISDDGSTVVWTDYVTGVCCSGIEYPAVVTIRHAVVATGAVRDVATMAIGVGQASVSADGGTVAYVQGRPVSADEPEAPQGVSVWDAATGTARHVPGTTGGDGLLPTVGLSADGRRVAFTDARPNLVPGDGDGRADLFLWDTDGSRVTRVAAGGDADLDHPALSGDGGTVVFASAATGLVPDDPPGTVDLFAWDEAAP